MCQCGFYSIVNDFRYSSLASVSWGSSVGPGCRCGWVGLRVVGRGEYGVMMVWSIQSECGVIMIRTGWFMLSYMLVDRVGR